jgi:hypothetical protein
MKTDILERVARLQPELIGAGVAAHESTTVATATTKFERNITDFDNDPPWPGEWDNASR